jgi:hypothetical protein
MAELVDAPASGAGAGNGVEVRVLFRAPVFAYENHAARDFSENSRSDSEAPVRKVTLSSHLNALVKVIAGGCCLNPDA